MLFFGHFTRVTVDRSFPQIVSKVFLADPVSAPGSDAQTD
jgi:hypothetical protein